LNGKFLKEVMKLIFLNQKTNFSPIGFQILAIVNGQKSILGSHSKWPKRCILAILYTQTVSSLPVKTSHQIFSKSLVSILDPKNGHKKPNLFGR